MLNFDIKKKESGHKQLLGARVQGIVYLENRVSKCKDIDTLQCLYAPIICSYWTMEYRFAENLDRFLFNLGV